MGVFGHHVFDNDTSRDWVHLALVPVLRKTLNSKRRQLENWGAAEVVCRLLDTIESEELVMLSIEVVDDLLDDEEWIAAWKNPAPAVAELKKLRRKLRADLYSRWQKFNSALPGKAPKTAKRRPRRKRRARS